MFRSKLLIVLLPTIIGAVIGSWLWGPSIGLTPGDTRGPGIAAGYGGFVGLAIGLVLRAAAPLLVRAT